MSPRGTGGFSLIELLLVLLILGVLTEIVVPNFRAATLRARGADLVGRIDVVAQAARQYQGDTFAWPDDADAGDVPPGLGPYLPEGFSFVGPDFVLDWENVPIPGGLPGSPGTERLLGVGVVTDYQDLGEAMVALLGQSGWYNVGNSYVRIIER